MSSPHSVFIVIFLLFLSGWYLVQLFGSSRNYHVRHGMDIDCLFVRDCDLVDRDGRHTSYFGYALQCVGIYGLGLSCQDVVVGSWERARFGDTV